MDGKFGNSILPLYVRRIYELITIKGQKFFHILHCGISGLFFSTFIIKIVISDRVYFLKHIDIQYRSIYIYIYNLSLDSIPFFRHTTRLHILSSTTMQNTT